MMHLFRSLLFCTFFISIISKAQELPVLTKKDSANLLISLATDKTHAPPRAEAERLLKQAHLLATSINDESAQARSAFLLARFRKDANQIDQALEYYFQAAKLYEQLGDSAQAGRCYIHIGSVYIYHLTNYTKGFQYCTRAVSLLENDTIYRPAALSNLASLLLQTKKYDEALSIYRQSYIDEQKNNNLRGMCLALNNIATAYDGKKDFKQSYLHYEKALNIARSMNDNKMISHILIGMSPVQCQMGDHALASELADQALMIAREHGFENTQISALCILAYEAGHHDKFDEAKKFLFEAEQIATRAKLVAFKKDIYGILSDVFNRSGNKTEALRYLSKQTQLIDSMANAERLAINEIAGQQPKEQNTDRAPVTASAAFPMKSGTLAVGVVLILAGIGFVFYKAAVERKQETIVIPIAEEVLTPEIKNDNKTDVEGDRHLEVLHGQGVKLVALKDIWWFQKEGKLYQAVAKDGQYRVRQTIAELDELLENTNFFRVNRSVIINLDQMNNYSFWENHKYIIRMKDPARTEFIISRNRLREMKEVFQVIEGS